jgi:hypothetical protein
MDKKFWDETTPPRGEAPSPAPPPKRPIWDRLKDDDSPSLAQMIPALKSEQKTKELREEILSGRTLAESPSIFDFIGDIVSMIVNLMMPLFRGLESLENRIFKSDSAKKSDDKSKGIEGRTREN